jgi:uncharacterized ParB-like nuclease family protein
VGSLGGFCHRYDVFSNSADSRINSAQVKGSPDRVIKQLPQNVVRVSG